MTTTNFNHFIGGEWTASSGTDQIDVVNPSTEEIIGSVVAGTDDDVDRAVKSAVDSFATWQFSTTNDRKEVLRTIRDGIASRRKELADLISDEMGMPRSWSYNAQTGNPLAVLDDYIRILDSYPFEERLGNSLITREPAGVAAAIAPWNFPIHQVIAKVAPAIAAGCTIVVKPSELTPLSGLVLADIIRGARIQPGVINIVNGTGSVAGEALTTHPGIDLVSFTGSLRAGQRVAENAAKSVKRVTLELGGKSPNILLDNVDIEMVIPRVIQFDAFLNCGQVCSAFTRLLVPRRLQDQVLAIGKAVAEGLRVGPAEEDLDLGPLVSAAQRDRVEKYIQLGLDEGARLVTGGLGRPNGLERGFFVKPTIFADVHPEMTIAREEIFGPVLVIIPFDDVEEAIAIANASEYGLAASVYSGSDDVSMQIARRLRAGQVNINGGAFNVYAPFGGFKKSGYGREMGVWGLEEFLAVKSYQLPVHAE